MIRKRMTQNRILIGYLLLNIVGCIGGTATAQTIDNQAKTEYVYKQKVEPLAMDNYLFSTYYYNGKKTYNLRSFAMGSVSGEVSSMKINPSGTTFAVLYEKGEYKQLAIFDLWKQNSVKHQFKDIDNPLAVCYSADARSIYICTSDKLLCYDLNEYQQQWSIDMPFEAEALTVSANG